MLLEVKSDDQLRAAIAGPGLRVVYFCADWCGPCKAFAPIIEKASAEFADSVSLFKAKVEDTPEETVKRAVWSVPTLLAFRDGVQIDSRQGSQTRPAFASWLESLKRM